MIVDVKSIVLKKKEELKSKVKDLNRKGVNPKLAVILANKEEASRIYVSKKRKMCEELGILEEEYELDETTTTQDVLQIIQKLNADESVHGILVQLPIFKHLDEEKILNSIEPEKDVDGFHPVNLGKLLIGEKAIVSCTPKGIMQIIDSLGETIEGKRAVVVGRSRIVGKPMACLLLKRGATVTVCHSKTKDLKAHTKEADILVVATGNPHLITADMVKKGAIVIDVGINRTKDGIVGDVDTNAVKEIAKYITPVPGGVGLTTVVSLLDNVIEIANNSLNIED